MKHKDFVILKKIIQYCGDVREACEMFDNRFEAFQKESVFRNAACMCILQIGELCKVVSDELREGKPEIPWREWCGIRDIFAHQYSNLDYDSAWDTIQHDLPALEKELRQIIADYTKKQG